MAISVEPSERHRFDEVDITTAFLSAASGIRQCLVKVDRLRLFDAMSAICLMDEKMDAGIVLRQRRFASLDEGVAKGVVKLEGFSPRERLRLLDRCLAMLALWLDGEQAPQYSTMTCVYLEDCMRVDDCVVGGFLVGYVRVLDQCNEVIGKANCFDADDFQVGAAAGSG